MQRTGAEADRSVAAFGIEFGGIGIKGGVVDLRNGALIGDRCRPDTPHPGTQAEVVAAATRLDFTGPVGVTSGVVAAAEATRPQAAPA